VNRVDINCPGTLNGQPATVTLVLIDNGERKGAPPDQVYIAINGGAITGGSVDSPRISPTATFRRTSTDPTSSGYRARRVVAPPGPPSNAIASIAGSQLISP
jgi:hypothetical protein